MRHLALLNRMLLILACLLAGFSVVVLGLAFKPLGIVLLAFLAWRRLRRRRGSGWSHGSAKWADLLRLTLAGLMGNSGPILGRVAADPPRRIEAVRLLFAPSVPAAMACGLFLSAILGERWSRDRFVRLPSHVHLITCAPSGRGKGTSVILPNLLALPGPVVVTDPGGVNYRVAAEHRRRYFGHRVLRLDPFFQAGPGADTWNVLLCIDPAADDLLEQCRDVANMLVYRQGTEHEPHWNDSAELIICGVIAFVCVHETDPATRTLSLVRKIVSSPERLAATIAVMQKTDHPGVKRLGELMSWFKEKELSGVLTTVNRHTQFLDSPAIAACVASSSFDPRELRGGKLSLFFILPHERLTTLAPLMRLWVGMTLRLLARGGADESSPVMFIIDEAAHLGRIQVLEDAVTLMRGVGIRLWFFFQSISQLKACYGDHAEAMLDNFDTQQFVGTNSYENAEAISKRIGEFTLNNVSYSQNTGWSMPTATVAGKDQPGSRSGGSSYTAADMARRLIRPEEILCLPDDVALVMHRNLPPFSTRLAAYFAAPEFRKGRCGKQRGTMLAASVVAASLFVVTVVFASIVHDLPAPGPWRPGRGTGFSRVSRRDDDAGMLPPPIGYPAGDGAARQRTRRDPSLPSQSGFLIQIR